MAFSVVSRELSSLLSSLMVAGFPSVGKSTLLTNLAGVYSEVAAYEFTTLTTVPGVIRYKGAKVQVKLLIMCAYTLAQKYLLSQGVCTSDFLSLSFPLSSFSSSLFLSLLLPLALSS